MSKTIMIGSKSLRAIAHDAMLQAGLLPDFSAAVLRETEGIHAAAAASGPAVRDLRDLVWFSIDNDDSRDLDQLTAAQSRPGDEVRVLVAIADVDAIVKKGSAIDGHASTNTTSVYTAAGNFPMLPEKLSTDLTSLGEGVERLAVVADMIIAADGSLVSGDIYAGCRVEQGEARLQRRRGVAGRSRRPGGQGERGGGPW